ncbi:DUF222 domain-containing protein [Citricoccus sp. NPDC055426]|uniref:HNH endonuclease n=1 Tax=Citricoccus sp. NPDC055426 TaxID=3155536 RepID=UPI00342F7439
MFEDADRASGVTSPHGAASPVPALTDAQAIIGLRDCLAGMVPAASVAALQTSTAGGVDGVGDRYAAGRFGPSEHERAVLSREAEAIHRIRALEDLKAACAAAQARETAALHHHRILDEAARGIPATRRGLGLGSEIGLARRQSPQRGSTHLRQARHLTDDLPNTLTALQTGQISEDHAATVERHTHWLDAPGRRTVDTTLADRLPSLGLRELTHEVQAAAHRHDPDAAAAKYDEAVTDRHVRIKATDHGMAYLTALLPALQAAACYTAITDQAATTLVLGDADGRTPQQVLSDTFTERLTGTTPDHPSPVEIQLIMTDTTLLGASTDSSGSTGSDTGREPAWIPGHGPLPATIARKLIAGGTSTSDPDTISQSPEARVFLRRLFTCPETGQLVAMDAQRREFTGNLRRMIMLRDNICRTPYCGAPIRHVDHATPYRQGGPTSYANGSGLCERCNYTKEHPGWTHQTTPHDLEVTTPTGHHYTSHARPLTPPPLHAAAPPGTPQAAAPPGTPQAAPPTGTSSAASTTPGAHEPGSHRGPRDEPVQTPGQTPGQPAVPCTTDTTTVTVRLLPPPGATAKVTAAASLAAQPGSTAHQPNQAVPPRPAGPPRPAAQHRGFDLAWPLHRHRTPGTHVEYARAA